MKTADRQILCKLNENYTKFELFMRKFLYTDFYLISIVSILFIAWVTKCAPFGFAALISVSCLALITSDDILPLTVNIFGAVLMIFSAEISDFLYMWPTFIPLGIALVIFFIKNFRHKFKLGKMFFPQVAVVFALLLGGAGVISGEAYLRALPTTLILGVGVLAVYVLYNHFLKRDEKRDIPLYFARTLMYIGIVVCLELLVLIIRSHPTAANWGAYWNTGWGNRNNIATYLLFTAPMCFYLSTKYRNGWIYIIAGIMQYICLILTYSRGGILFGAVGAVFAVIFALVKAPDKKRQLLSFAAIIAVMLLIYAFTFKEVNFVLQKFFARGTSPSGRDILYREAVELLKVFPAFGAGVGYVGTGPGAMNVMKIYWFHSTFFQIIGTMGIIGLLLYVVNYGARLYLLFKGIKRKFNLFVLVIFIGFEGYSMIDTGTMVPFPNMMLIIVISLLLELTLKGDYSSDGVADAYNRTLPQFVSLSGTAKLDLLCSAPYEREV